MVKDSDECKKCLYLHPKTGKREYKCYSGDCPAKLKDDKKWKKLRKKVLKIKSQY